MAAFIYSDMTMQIYYIYKKILQLRSPCYSAFRKRRTAGAIGWVEAIKQITDDFSAPVETSCRGNNSTAGEKGAAGI